MVEIMHESFMSHYSLVPAVAKIRRLAIQVRRRGLRIEDRRRLGARRREYVERAAKRDLVLLRVGARRLPYDLRPRGRVLRDCE